MRLGLILSNESTQVAIFPVPNDELVTMRFEIFRAYAIELEVEALNKSSQYDIHFGPCKTR